MTDPASTFGPAQHLAQVRWSDPDQLGHVNHARYLSFFEDARMTLLAASPAGMPGAPSVARCECVLVAYSYADRKPRPLDDDERAFWQEHR